jgi:putative membrane protein
MIKSYSDHAANERTFLAWVRTAVAVMAFGFVIEKFALFLDIAGIHMTGKTAQMIQPRFSGVAGLALIVLGVLIVAVAGVRFIQTAKAIDDEALHAGPGSRVDVALASLLFLLGCALLAYLAPSVIAAL